MPEKKPERKTIVRPGRPSKYSPDYHPEHAFNYALMGATDEEIAAFFEISHDTLYAWKKQYPEFSEALARGKEPADARVARALYDRAVGYDYTDQQAFVDRFGDEHVVTFKKRLHPEPGAAKMWLTNRQPDKWRNKTEQAIGPNEEAKAMAEAGQPWAIVTINGKTMDGGEKP